MLQIKPIKSKQSQDQGLSILTSTTNRDVNMFNQKINSESALEEIESISSYLCKIYNAFDEALKVNSKLKHIIDQGDFFEKYEVFEDCVLSMVDKIKELPRAYKLTKFELSDAFEEMQEPENQSPFGAGSPSLEDVMGDI